MYQLTDFATVIRLSDGACIPMDAGNRDYQEYLAWVVAGGVPEPASVAVATEPVPSTEQSKRLEQSIERWKNG